MKSSIYDSLREATVLYRAKHRVSQRSMAEQIGCTQASLSAWEKPGGTVLREDYLTRLMELLGIQWEGSVPYSQGTGISHLIAGKLTALVEYLESPLLSEESKLRELSSVIKSINDSLTAVRNRAHPDGDKEV